MNNATLKTVDAERDLVVIINKNAITELSSFNNLG